MKPDPKPPIPLTITALGAGADGIGEYRKKPVFVPKTVAGDVIEARIFKKTRDHWLARMTQIHTPGPARADPPCPHYAECGGCSLQHVTQQFYRDWKIESVKTTLHKAGVEPLQWGAPVFIPPGQRRRVTWTARRSGGRIFWGQHSPRSQRIIDLETCLLLRPALETALTGLKDYLPRLLTESWPASFTLQEADGALDLVIQSLHTAKAGLTLEQNEALAEYVNAFDIARLSLRAREESAIETLLNRKPVFKRFGTLYVAIPPAAFLQPSQAGEDALCALVNAAAKDAANVADLFAGCGTFSGQMLQNQIAVTAIDSDGPAVAALEKAAPKNLNVQQRNLFENPLSPAELNAFDAVILDPPRAGAMTQAQSLAQSAVPRIIYVSCGPASFARDAQSLIQGGYRLETLTVVDQFVWSPHAELVGVFEKI